MEPSIDEGVWDLGPSIAINRSSLVASTKEHTKIILNILSLNPGTC